MNFYEEFVSTSLTILFN